MVDYFSNDLIQYRVDEEAFQLGDVFSTLSHCVYLCLLHAEGNPSLYIEGNLSAPPFLIFVATVGENALHCAHYGCMVFPTMKRTWGR